MTRHFATGSGATEKPQISRYLRWLGRPKPHLSRYLRWLGAPACGSGAGLPEHRGVLLLGGRVLTTGLAEDDRDVVERLAHVRLGAAPLRRNRLEPGCRLAAPGVLQRGEPAHHGGDLAVDLGADPGDVAGRRGDPLGVDLERGAHGRVLSSSSHARETLGGPAPAATTLSTAPVGLSLAGH